ncbi:MAG: nodulation protein NfeD [Bdellovibrionales bacterium]|nr:nodulation protein NfeD [Bdellovibrionales bacterium]
MSKFYFRCLRLTLLISVLVGCLVSVAVSDEQSDLGTVMIANVDGPISPATDDYLRMAIENAEKARARLLVVKLNTPGGLLTSMQSMVENILQSKVPVMVYVSPSGGGAISAGVFITLAGHLAVMAPGTTIGAAHPVTGSGQDVGGDMREKLENFAVSLIKAISEQRGRNVRWAEQAVRESVAITDREALDENVIDYIASDLSRALADAEGRTITVNGNPVTLKDLREAPQREIEMTLRQQVVAVLSDPNIAVLLGLGAMVGIAIELFHPGVILPGVVGVICLILSLTAAQVLPINFGGLALLLLGGAFFVVEMMVPSFGIWGAAGIICFVLGSIYFVDTDMIWGAEGFTVDRLMVGSIAAVAGMLVLAVVYLVVKTGKRKVEIGTAGLVGQLGSVRTEFEANAAGNFAKGKVHVFGELWNARISLENFALPKIGDTVRVQQVGEGMVLTVVPDEEA